MKFSNCIAEKAHVFSLMAACIILYYMFNITLCYVILDTPYIIAGSKCNRSDVSVNYSILYVIYYFVSFLFLLHYM